MPDLYRADKNQNEDASLPKFGGFSNPLSAFCYQPKKARFETQESTEEIVLLLRRHPLTNLPWVLAALALALAPTVFAWFPLYTDLPLRFQTGTVVLWYFLTSAVAITGALTWFFNVNIVTNQRILDVDFYTLLYREISDARIDKIQEVTYKVGGLGGTLFDYGDVLIQTAGAIPNFEFEAVPHPGSVARILEGLQGGVEK